MVKSETYSASPSHLVRIDTNTSVVSEQDTRVARKQARSRLTKAMGKLSCLRTMLGLIRSIPGLVRCARDGVLDLLPGGAGLLPCLRSGFLGALPRLLHSLSCLMMGACAQWENSVYGKPVHENSPSESPPSSVVSSLQHDLGRLPGG